jgi:hypothetical protein
MKYSELYEYLDAFSEKTEQDIVEEIDNWKDEQANALVETLFELIKNDYFEKPSFFNMYSNSTLAGGRYPCFSAECRLNNVNNLIRYASLYADKVLVPSPFDTPFEKLERGERINRYDLAIDILILLKLKPLVLAGIIGFFSSYICLCNDCLKKIIKKEENVEKELKKIETLINKECAQNIKCYLLRDRSGIAYFSIEGAEKYGYHEQTEILMLEESVEVKRLLKKSNGEAVDISIQQLKQFGLVSHLLQPAIEDIFQAQINTSFIDSSYITNRISDIEIMEQLNEKKTNSINDTKVISNNIFHNVPLIGNANIDDIIYLRQKDGESFDIYRDSINKLLRTYNTLDRYSILEVQRDIIDPELHKIKSVIKRNKNKILKSTAIDACLLSAGVGIGIFSGILPIDYSAVMGVIGGIPTIKNIVSNVAKGTPEIKNNNFYFLYELEKKTEKL